MNEKNAFDIVVYASSTSDGMFKELVQLYKGQIIRDDQETEDGVLICRYTDEEDDGKETMFYYIDKTEIKAS